METAINRKGFNVRKVPTYTLTDGRGFEYKVEFYKEDNIPDEAYRVVIYQGGAGGWELEETDWFTRTDEFSVNGDTAVYFATKHGAAVPSDR